MSPKNLHRPKHSHNKYCIENSHIHQKSWSLIYTKFFETSLKIEIWSYLPQYDYYVDPRAEKLGTGNQGKFAISWAWPSHILMNSRQIFLQAPHLAAVKIIIVEEERVHCCNFWQFGCHWDKTTRWAHTVSKYKYIMYSVSRQMQVCAVVPTCGTVDSSGCQFHFLLATVGPLLPVLVTSLDNI